MNERNNGDSPDDSQGIGESGGRGRGHAPSLSFWGKIGQNNKFAPPSLGFALPSGKSWVRHYQISLSIKFMANVTMCGLSIQSS